MYQRSVDHPPEGNQGHVGRSRIQARAAPEDRIIIFDTTLRDGEQSPGASMTVRREGQDRPAARADGRRRHRGGLRDRLAGRLPGGPARSPRRSRTASSARWRAPAAPTSTAPPRRSSRRAQKRIHTFIATSPLHMRGQAAEDARAGAPGGDRQREPRAPLVRRRRVVVRGRLALGARLPLPLHRERDRLPAPPRSTSRTPSATPTRRSSPT